ncbi:MAG TPA: FAD-dependent oxidoreductase [Ktedonobacterales bacterium]|nr:FAD-dependent oxidoreductase [Ktedonobacterales bacterium]
MDATRSRRSTGAPAPPNTQPPWGDDLSSDVRQALTLDPAPERRLHADVVVIGAGVAGLSAAITARQVGADVLVLEAERDIGRGATGRNAGILSAGVNMALAGLPLESPLREMWPATTRELLGLVEQATRPGALLQASLTGALSLAERPSAARYLEREAKARTGLGLHAEMWTAQQVAEAGDGRLDARGMVAAMWLPDEGRIQPLTLLAHLACEARALGVRLLGGARVREHMASAGRSGLSCWRLSLASGGTVEAGGLVEAVGPTAAPTARIYAMAFPADLPDDFPLFWDSAPFTYCDFRPGNARLGISGGRYGRAGAFGRDPHYHARLATAARRWLPELAPVAPTHAWAVDLAVAPHMVPDARDLGARAPGRAIEGLGALGVLPGVILGRQAGEEIARRLS